MLLPSGSSASLFSDVNYSIPGAFLFSDLLFKCLDIIENKVDYAIPIKFMYGSPNFLWSGGRLIIKNNFSLYNDEDIEKEIISIKNRNITPLITFSNSKITEDDLKDSRCNYVLSLLNSMNCGVIIASDILRKYIAENFSNISIHASVIFDSFEEKRDSLFYKKLSDIYDYYVVHPDDNFNNLLLDSIPKNNAEILLNEKCHYACKIRKNHYLSISNEQKMLACGKYKSKNFLRACSSIPINKQAKTKERNISLTIQELKDIRNKGFTLFKLQGRTDDLSLFFFDFLRYTLENNLVFPTIYPIILHYIEEFKKRLKC